MSRSVGRGCSTDNTKKNAQTKETYAPIHTPRFLWVGRDLRGVILLPPKKETKRWSLFPHTRARSAARTHFYRGCLFSDANLYFVFFSWFLDDHARTGLSFPGRELGAIPSTTTTTTSTTTTTTAAAAAGEMDETPACVLRIPRAG